MTCYDVASTIHLSLALGDVLGKCFGMKTASAPLGVDVNGIENGNEESGGAGGAAAVVEGRERLMVWTSQQCVIHQIVYQSW